MKFLKGAVVFLLGACVGASGSYIYFKKQYNEKKLELDELKDHYMNKLSDDTDKDIAENIIKKEGYISYNIVQPNETTQHIETVEEVPMSKEPIIITEEEYSEQELSFEKFEIDYYVEDGALVDESDELLIIEDTIGYDNIEKTMADESETLFYVRNASKNADYMVHIIHGKYSEMIGVGGDDTDE